jgi:hypothetical protein
MSEDIPDKKTDPKRLDELIELARNHKMSPTERFEQTLSFVASGSSLPKDQVRAMMVENASVPKEVLDQYLEQYKYNLKAKLEKMALDYTNTPGMSSKNIALGISKAILEI